MDRISGLSDDLLVMILSFLPTKVAISSSILSKRWECLWKWLPKLEYVSRREGQSSRFLSERESLLRCFLNKTMPLHRASVIESFPLDLAFSGCKPEDAKLWVEIAVSRFLRELDVSYHDSLGKANILPSSLYACKSLVTLKLDGYILLDVPRMVGLPSLKNLQLHRVKFLDGQSFRRLLSICPVLQHLLVEFRGGIHDNMGTITVIVPSLHNLSLLVPYNGILDGLVIDTPSLKYLKLEDYREDNHSCLIEKMPMLGEAYLDVNFADIERLMGSITSVKRLTLSSEALYGGGFVYNQLEHLNLCLGTNSASNLLVRLLEGSPSLGELDLVEMDHKYGSVVSWNQPETVPKCFMSSLQTFNWSGYIGSPEQRDIAVYILTNACRLKTATFSSDDTYTPKYEMIKELSLSSRASTTCRLVFD